MKLLHLAAAGLALLSFGIPCQEVMARPIKVWTKSELMEKADLVVVAIPVGSQESSGVPSAENGWIVGVETTFRIEALLKGKVSDPPPSLPTAIVVGPHDSNRKKLPEMRITVSHYRHAAGHEHAVDGPTYVRFDGQSREYLLFLKKTSQSSYEPLSGQHDPYFSVFVVAPYSDLPAVSPKSSGTSRK
jgi:hypothetical protein